MKLLRVRFLANLEDCRPVNYPVLLPWWKTGETEDNAVIVAYAPDEHYIFTNWPEAKGLDIQDVDKITFTSRFPKGKWENKTIPYEVLP